MDATRRVRLGSRSKLSGRLLSMLSMYVLLFALGPRVAEARLCAKDADCPGEEVCERGRCASPAGTSTAKPAPTQGRATACGKDTDCPGEEVCRQGRCESTAVAPAPPPKPTPPPRPVIATLKVTSDPTGAAVLVDEKDSGQKTPATLSLPPGHHTIKVTLSGHQAWERELDLEQGETAPLEIKLVLTEEEVKRRATVAAKRQEEAKRALEARHRYEQTMASYEQQTAPDRERRRKKTILGASATAAGAAFLVAAVVIYGVGGSGGTKAHDRYMAATDQDVMNKYRHDIKVARTELIVGHILAGVGAAALGLGIWQLVTRPEISEPPSPPPGLAGLGLTPRPHGALVSLAGSF
jgi:hypothetical protein